MAMAATVLSAVVLVCASGAPAGAAVTVSPRSSSPSCSALEGEAPGLVAELSTEVTAALAGVPDEPLLLGVVTGLAEKIGSDALVGAVASASGQRASIELTPSSGPAGMMIFVSGHNYFPCQEVDITGFSASDNNPATGELSVETDTSGNFAIAGDLPPGDNVVGTSYPITATEVTPLFGIPTYKTATAYFTVSCGGPSAALAPTSGPAGTVVTLTGTGFCPREVVNIYESGTTPNAEVPLEQVTADGSGDFTTSFAMPAVDSQTGGTYCGSQAINAWGASGNDASSVYFDYQSCGS